MQVHLYADFSHKYMYRKCIFLTIFFKDLFIYLFDTERERQPAREGTQAGGVGEEEAGFPWRSLMWGSIPQPRDHARSRSLRLND